MTSCNDAPRAKPIVRFGLLILWALSPAAVNAGTLQVPSEYKNIQAAIDASHDGDEIVVAAGTYKEAINFNGKAVHLHSADGQETTIIDAAGLNASVVTCATGEGPDTILEGFTVTGGTGTRMSYDTGGGGMYNESSDPTVRKCRFTRNSAKWWGGGMLNYRAAPTIIDCALDHNSAGNGVGGGMRNIEGAPHVENCTFSENDAQRGGGMDNQNGATTVVGCTFESNSANFAAGISNNENRTTLIDCTLVGNFAAYGDGAGVASFYADVTTTGCTFRGNSASSDYGGSGAALYHVGNALTLANCLFADNSANSGPYGPSYGGAITAYAAEVSVRNCTFTRNTADFGGAIALVGASAAAVANSVFWNDAAAEGTELCVGTSEESAHPSLGIAHCDVSGGEFGVYVGTSGTLHWGDGNIDADPFFVDSENDDFHLSPDSPAIDAGSNALIGAAADIDGECRVSDGDNDTIAIVDMGIDEAPGTPIDCNANGVCDTQEPGDDCNHNLLPDECDLSDGWSQDCNANGVPDECDLAGGTSPDCNRNGVPDECDLANGSSQDVIPPGGDGIPDDCGWVHNETRDLYYVSIQSAIDAASDGDELLVGQSTYREAIDFLGKSIHVRSVAGPEKTIIDGWTKGGSVVTFASRETSDSVLDGFTVTGGGGKEVCSYWVDGGHGGYWFTISGGGGIFVGDASPTITRCIIAGNSSGWGGGLFVGDGGHADVTDALFTRNSGGAFACSGGTFELTRCTIENNAGGGVLSVEEYSTGCSWYGGAGEIVDCTIQGNRGPGIWGATYSNQLIKIRACTVAQNETGIICDGCDISDCVIASNSPGGGVTLGTYYSGRKNLIRDSLILGNESEYVGGGIRSWVGESSIAGCTVVGNAAGWAGGGLATHQDIGDPPNARIVNSIFAGNSAPAGAQLAVLDLYERYGSALAVAYSDVEGGQAAVQVDRNSRLTWGEGNIDADPLFVRNPSDGGDGWGDDPNTPDFDESSNDDYGNLQLTAESPCIDAGNNAELISGIDADGHCRVMDGDGDGAPVLDMGPYEVLGAVPDCNRDGVCDCQQADQGDAPDCNRNLVPDECDIADGSSQDVVPVGGDGVPDECQRVVNVTQNARYRWIQDALDVAADGDEVVVTPDTYNEAIDFCGKAVRLHSAAGPATAIIDATGLYDSAVTCANGETSSTILEGFTITGGAAHSGGGMYNYESSPTVINCTFRRNSASFGGGGVYNWSGEPTVTDCTFIGNSAGRGGGGGMYNWSGRPTVTNCTFSGNRVSGSDGTGGAIHLDGGSVATASNLTLWGNSAPNGKQLSLGAQKESALTIAYSDVQGGKAGAYIKNNSKLNWGAGNLNADPRFVRNPSDGGDGWGDDPNTSDFDESSNDDYGDLRLPSDSPCIDVGDPKFNPPPGARDLVGNKRLWDGDGDSDAIVDMGAYEFASRAYGDLNCDGGVDFNDIDAFVAALAGREEYEQTYPDCAHLLADVNSDGSVSFDDIDEFVGCLIDGGCL